MRSLNRFAPRDGRFIHRRRVFENLLFSQCWEDPELDRRALRVPRGGTVLAVTSGGCTALALALDSPGRVIAVDMNSTQTALLELKMAGARRLEHGPYLELLGVRSPRHADVLYRHCRKDLTPEAAAYWDANPSQLRRGLLRAGRYERYLEGFRRLLILIQGPRRLRELFELETEDHRRRFYHDEWNHAGWRSCFRLFFSRAVLGRFGLDPAFFTYANEAESFGEHFLRLAEHALVDLPPRDNYFLAQICLGRYLDEEHVPPYLRADTFPQLRHAVDRIHPATAELGSLLESLPANSVDAFALSNIFEWVSPEVFEEMLRRVHRVARPGARLCYRNLLVPRRHPEALNSLFRPLPEEAAQLLPSDRAFVYSNFHVAQALPAPARETSHEIHHPAVAIPDSPVDPHRPELRDDRVPAHRAG